MVNCNNYKPWMKNSGNCEEINFIKAWMEAFVSSFNVLSPALLRDTEETD
jgi:hypothetical protein